VSGGLWYEFLPIILSVMTKYDKMMTATIIGRFLLKIIEKKDILNKYHYIFNYWPKSGQI
jgi:hypothetical protein